MNPKTIGDEVVKALGKMRGEKVSLWELRQAEEYIKIVLQGFKAEQMSTRRLERGRPTQQVDGFYDSFAVCPRGTYGHPNVDPAPRTASPDLLERAMAAYQFTRPDNRFANLVSRFYRFMSW